MEKRNGFIDLLRFVAAIAVMLHHTYIIGARRPYFLMGGYLAVEFFFFLSGYYIVKKMSKINLPENISHYAMKTVFLKFKKLYFYVFVMIIIHYLYILLFKINTIEILKNFPFEIMLMHITTCSSNFLLIPLWYLSALMFALPIFIYIYLKNKQFCDNILFWIIPCLIYGLLYKKIGYVAAWDVNFQIFSSGFLRCLAGLFVGGLIFMLSEKLKTVIFKKTVRIFLTIISFLITIRIIIILSNYYATSYDFVVIIYMIVLLIILFAEQLCFNIPCNRFFTYLGSLSLPMFVSHFTIGKIIEQFGINLLFKPKLILFFAITIIWSIIFKSIYNLIIKNDLKKLIIK